MKTLLFLLLVFFPALTILAEPTKGNPPTKGQLVGRWRLDEGGVVSEHIFRADGSFTASHMDLAFAGRWSLSADIIIYKYTKVPERNPPFPTTDRDQLIEVTKDFYVIKAIGTDGETRKYSRVK